jgi:DNA-binding transcriptional MerR regulator
MAKELLIGELAAKTGASRKALRLYESLGILTPTRRTASGYRVYDTDASQLLAFVRQAQRLGFTLEEIKEIVRMRRSGRTPCRHVRELVQRKERGLEQRVEDLRAMQRTLRRLLSQWRTSRANGAAVCPHIEGALRKTRLRISERR